MRWLKLGRRIGGTILFIVGIFSLVFPIVPGWLLIALGLYVLSIDSPGLTRRFEQLHTRYPIGDWLRKLRQHALARFVRKSEDAEK